MICTGILAIIGARTLLRRIIRRIPIGKAIRHDEVDKIISVKAMKAIALWPTFRQRKIENCASARGGDRDGNVARFCIAVNLEPNEKIMTAIRRGLCALTPHVGYPYTPRLNL